ncbi:MAG: decaprenyl-phosphate phosphoribosyltransferase, partial [Acidobacteriota bacterium]
MAVSAASGAVEVTPASRVGSTLLGCWELLRWPQWLKNGFVFAPLLFAGELRHARSVQLAWWAFVSFCMLASSVYVMNDWFDRERDRRHPHKSRRPIASGAIPAQVAWGLASALLAGALAVAATLTNAAVVALELAFAGLNLAYSLHLKKVVILDAFVVAAGFVLRVWVGAYAVGVPASHWLILCTLMLALFLALGKRHAELAALDGESANHRQVLASYSIDLITHMNLVACAATVVCYALYTVSPDTVARFRTDRLVYSVPFVIYGLFRYLYLLERKGGGGSPSRLVLLDRPLLVCIALWALYCL